MVHGETLEQRMVAVLFAAALAERAPAVVAVRSYTPVRVRGFLLDARNDRQAQPGLAIQTWLLAHWDHTVSAQVRLSRALGTVPAVAALLPALATHPSTTLDEYRTHRDVWLAGMTRTRTQRS
jgi:hypothetical protein